jgi:hypothetical protein
MGYAGAAFGIGAKAGGLVDALALAPKAASKTLNGERARKFRGICPWRQYEKAKGRPLWSNYSEGVSPKPPGRPLAPDDQLATPGQSLHASARSHSPVGISPHRRLRHEGT